MDNKNTICRVLLVDDSPEDRAELRRLLLSGSERRFHFTEAETGDACLKACLNSGTTEFDCVLLDYHLPDYDAPELLLALGGTESIVCPIVVVTGSFGVINSSKLLGNGAQDFISKSWINPESLTRAVENAIERYALNQELKASHQLFKAFLENTAVIAWMKDAQGRYSFLSQNYEKRYQVSLEDWQGKTDFDFWPEAMAQKFNRDDLQVLSSQFPLETIEEALNPDGSISWWFTSKFPYKDQHGQQYVGGLGVDITERKQAELALQESEAKLSAMFQQATAGVAETDMSGRFILVNEQFCLMAGRSRETLLALNSKDITHPEDLAKCTELLERCIKDGQNFVNEKRILRPDGSSLWIQNNVTLLRDAQGQPLSILAISFDIEARLQIEAKLRKQTDLLQDADRRKDEFLAMLAHELRNPLTPISNAAHMLSSDSLDASLIARLSVTLNRNVKHITRLVDDLLDVSRITHNFINIKWERIDLNQLLNDSAESVQPMIISKQQTLKLNLSAQPQYIDGDTVRLTQVFSNLLNNAAKYTGTGGLINVNVTMDDTANIIRIQDTGIGINEKLLPHVFDLFTQGERGLDRSEGGLGIGLTLVKKLVELHGGLITAHSAGVNQGSEFVVRLPKLINETIAFNALNPKQTTEETEKGLRVLLIDDNEDITESLSVWFTMLQNTVEIAANGQLGLLAAQRFNPHVIILDIGLPDLDGYHVVQKLREQFANRKVLIIALSGYECSNDRHDEAACFDYFMMKPPDLNQLQTVITKYYESIPN